jgi:hypothetical protein
VITRWSRNEFQLRMGLTQDVRRRL